MDAKSLEFLTACCIGDGCLYRCSKGYVSLSIKHGAKQRSYLEHKAARLNEILGSSAKVRDINNNGYPGSEYRVYSTKVLTPLHRELYGSGKKTVTQRCLDSMGAAGFAVWWMDDGSLTIIKRKTKSGGVTNGARIGWLSTYTETRSESEMIAEWIEGVIGFRPRALPNKGKFRLHFNSHALRKLCPVLQPYMIPSMSYKTDFGAINKIHVQTSPAMFTPKHLRKPEGDKLARVPEHLVEV